MTFQGVEKWVSYGNGTVNGAGGRSPLTVQGFSPTIAIDFRKLWEAPYQHLLIFFTITIDFEHPNGGMDGGSPRDGRRAVRAVSVSETGVHGHDNCRPHRLPSKKPETRLRHGRTVRKRLPTADAIYERFVGAQDQ